MYIDVNNVPRKLTFKSYFGKYIFPIYLLVIITLVLVVPSLYNSTLEFWDSLFLTSNFIIGAISFFMILHESGKRPYSLHLIHWLFLYIFFFIAPLVQYLNNAFQWGMLTSSQIGELRYSNLIIIIWQLFWIIANTRTTKNQKETIEVVYTVSKRKIKLLTYLSFAVLCYLIYVYGISGIFTRGAMGFEKISDNSSVALLFLYIGRTIPLVLFASVMHIRRVEGKNIFTGTLILSLILLVLINFPSATPRFWSAAVYLGVFIILTRFKSKSLLILMLIVGLNIVFPILGEARRQSTLSGFLNSISSDRLFSKNILIGDYDAFSMVTYTHIFVDNWAFTMGKQLLTAIFFFVPREVWPSKSTGSGSMIADHLGLIFNNVSCPLISEGFINFGIPGVIVFAIFFSTLTTKIDYLYWSRSNFMVSLAYPFWLALFFFMMRGDLLSTLSFTAGLTFVFFIFTRNKKRKSYDSNERMYNSP